MKIFVQSEWKLSDLNPGMKTIAAGFLVLVLFGYLTGLIMGVMKSGVGAQALSDYYRGNEELMTYPKSALELLEISHFHCLSMPVVFMIVGHLMMMTSVGLKWRIFMVALGFGGMVLDLVSPWLIRYVSGGFVGLKLFGSGIFGLSFLGMILIEIFELFFKKRSYELTDVV